MCAPVFLIGALSLAGCSSEYAHYLAAAQPRGATVAFESINGLPQKQFDTLVQDLNKEAQARRLAVMAREEPCAYRIRGQFAVAVVEGKTTMSWTWDVLDRNRQRALRISGSEPVTAASGSGWDAVDDAALARVSERSMAKLAAFLTDPAVARRMPAGEPQAASAPPAAYSPEAAGIFRIFRPHANPVSEPGPVHAASAEATGTAEGAVTIATSSR